MYNNLTMEELEARIDEIGDKLAAAPKDRQLFAEMERLLMEHTDRINRAVY